MSAAGADRHPAILQLIREAGYLRRRRLDWFLGATRRMLKLRALTQASFGVALERSELDDLAGVRGTATIVLDTVFKPHSANIFALRRAGSAGLAI